MWIFPSCSTTRKKIEKGECIISYPKKIFCSYDNTKKKIMVSNGKSLVIKNQTNNQYGTAGSLGGASRLRSYAGGRFSGAQVEFRGAEFRWNLTDENKPFDLLFIRDVRTGVQLAFFYEEGSVADTSEQLWDEKRTSQGAGVRLVTSSGFVYRFDLATGQEGREVILFVDYPWGTIGQ